ncbi:sensor histidine kinase [Roseinatronobacter alkalisoli]|uniref:histidine kinase n=1 Tax=Roseinatronobacter alkalisoli TaxID=3028235 RepID=A0ABT5T7I0_9RHOB|nr:sensor histidine kinase [Roseinatronobacter sp. HJB301]MDD7971085.1 sensor histidine kinase [Roseinatronobacter sp. HJB301]
MDERREFQTDTNKADIPEHMEISVAESDHRIANSLSLTAALLRMQRQKSADAILKNALLSAEARIMSIAKFHAYLHTRSTIGRVNLADACIEILPDLSKSVGVRCLLEIEDAKKVDVSRRLAQKLMVIINELALNARKHAYEGQEGGSISVELRPDAGHRVNLCVQDSGPGLPENFDPAKSTGLGLRIVSSLVADLDGTLHWQTNGGAQFTISIPLD